MADRKSTLTAVLVDSVSGPAKKIQAEITGIGTSVSHVSSILTGVGVGIGEEIFRGIGEAIGAVARAIPELLGRGNAYLDQLHQIQLETGMTAEQASTLVGALRSLGVPTESLDVLFARLGANIGKNEGLFKSLGVATRAADGTLLNSYVIFQNLRRAVSEHGESLLSTAAAQELFGRSGFKIIEALQASDEEWKAATENVRRWGGVVSQAAIAGADRFGDTLASLQQGITDIGVNIAAAVDPFLRAFVDSFSRFVQAHLNEIVQFAVNVVNVVTGFISGLFGITNALSVSTDQAAVGTTKAVSATDTFGKVLKTASGGADAFTQSINAQIKAIDAHIHAQEQAAERRRAIQERQRLADSLHAAQAQLADLRGNAPFLGGLSSAEQALAVQKHAQDIIDAEKNVQDQRQAIGDFEADQKDRAQRELLNREKQRLQDSLAAHKAADAQILDSGLRMGAGLDAGLGTVLGNIGIRTQEFGKSAAASFQTGIDAARSFLNVLLGSEHSLGSSGGTYRSGGVISALGTLAGGIGALGVVVGRVASFIVNVATHLSDILPRVDVNKAVPGAGFDLWGFLLGQKPANKKDDWWYWLPGRASGGPVEQGQPYMVGENGPELFVPRNSGSIAANGLGAGGQLIVNFNSIWPPTEEQAQRITDVVSRRLAFALGHAPVTSLPFGSF